MAKLMMVLCKLGITLLYGRASALGELVAWTTERSSLGAEPVERALGRAQGRRGACRGRLLNRATTGLSDAALKLPWYAAHPQDPLGSPLRWVT